MICRLLVIAVVVFVSSTSLMGQVAGEAPDVRFVVLGHIRGDQQGGMNSKLTELLDEVRTLQPAFVVLTGDIIWGDNQNWPRDPERVEREWNEVDAALDTLDVPIYRVPGNHDISDVVTRDIWRRRYGTLPRVVSTAGVRLLLLSSAWIPEDDDQAEGLFLRGVDLDESQLRWLSNELERPSDASTFAFVHHLLWWEPDDGRWWTEVHPLLARAGVKAVISGDYGPLKFSTAARDGVSYFQTSIEGPVDLVHLQSRVSSRVLSAQFDNFLEVIVRDQKADVRVHTVGEVSSGEFTPSRYRAIVRQPRQGFWTRLMSVVRTPNRVMAFLLAGLGFAFFAGWWFGHVRHRSGSGRSGRYRTWTKDIFGREKHSRVNDLRSSSSSDSPRQVDSDVAPSRLGRAFLGLALLWLPLIFGSDLVSEAAELVHLADTANPYVIPAHAILLYGGFPLVIVSACVALMTPGLCVAIGLPGSNAEGWIVRGFGLTLPLVSCSVIMVQLVIGRPVTGAAFVAHLAGLSLLCALWGGRRAAAGRGSWPFTDAWLTVVATALVVPALLCAVLAPKFLWESFNGDGAHAMATARMAVAHAFPFWDAEAGLVSRFPGVSTMLFAFPASWFVRMFGEFEVAVRAPYLLVLVVAHSAIALVVTTGRRALTRTPLLLIWLGLTVYTAVQAYSVTYDPYSADLSMPGLPDTLQVVTFLGFVHTYLKRRWAGASWWLVLTLTSSPAGLPLVVFWLAAAWCFLGSQERRSVIYGAGILAAVVIILGVVPRLLAFVGEPAPGGEHGLGGLVQRFSLLQFTDWRRLVWVIVPSGIAPFLGFAVWNRLDGVGRALLLVASAHFLTFFVQSVVMIHHFVPAMLLPIVAWWRVDVDVGKGVAAWRTVVTALAGVSALWLSLPPTTAIVTAARLVGSSVEDRGGGYDQLDPAAFRRLDLLNSVLPKDAYQEVPDQRYGGSPLAWGYYADRMAAHEETPNYILVRPSDPSPTGRPPEATNTAGTLYVDSDAVWRAHLSLRPPAPAGSAIYRNPRGMLFGWPIEDGPWVLDLPAWLRGAGVDVEGLLGGERPGE